MKTSVKHLSETKVEITVNLDAEEIALAEKVALEKATSDVKVPGFRKGKAPVNVAAKSVDPNALQEQIINEAISKAIAKAYIDNNIQALERPFVDVKKFVPGETLEFVATSEILPKIKLGNYKNLKIKNEKIKVAASEVNDLIERMRQSLATKEEVKRAAKLDDEVVIDFVGKQDGKAFDGGTSENYSLKLGSNQFIPGFEEGIVGHKAGESFDLNLKFPADYHADNLAGAEVVFEVKLNKILESTLPEVDDQFAAKVGPFTSVEDMKKDIKRELKSQKEREAGEKTKDDLLNQLVEKSKVPVPEILVADQIRSIEQDFVSNLARQGLKLEDYIKNKGFKDKDAWVKDEVESVAAKRVQIGLLLAELSRQEKIEASSEEISNNIDMYKQQYANNADVLRQFDLPEVQKDIANRLITEKTVDKLVQLNQKNN